MKTSKDWINEITSQIDSLKRINLHNYYGFSLQMDKVTANQVKKHFEGQKYVVEIRVCPRKLFDCLISW